MNSVGFSENISGLLGAMWSIWNPCEKLRTKKRSQSVDKMNTDMMVTARTVQTPPMKDLWVESLFKLSCTGTPKSSQLLTLFLKRCHLVFSYSICLGGAIVFEVVLFCVG